MPQPREIIAICGPAGSGKTTLAKHLVHQGFVRVPFAEPIKVMLRALLAYQGLTSIATLDATDGDYKEVHMAELAGQTPRYAMQTLGTEWGRRHLDSNLWTSAWENRIAQLGPTTSIVVDDLRFKSEAQWIRLDEGKIIKILRPPVGRTYPLRHISELEWTEIEADLTLCNDGTIPDLVTKLNQFRGL